MMEELPIRTQQLELIKLQFNLSQELLWLTIQPLLDASTPRVWVIILKSRRAGISTEIESIMVSLCALFDRLFGTVIAHDAPASENIWKMAHTMATQGGLSGVADEEGKEIRFGNSLLRMATAGSPQKTRSYDNTALHLSETAFWPKPGAMLAAKQTVPKQGMSFLFNESTANGKVDTGEEYYTEWMRACTGDSDLTPFFFSSLDEPSLIMPGLRVTALDEEEQELRAKFDAPLEWLAGRRFCIRNYCDGDVQKFHQEYPTTPNEAFIATGYTFFQRAQLLWIERHILRGKRFCLSGDLWQHDREEGYLTVFVPPQKGHRYLIGADSSMGLELGDPSRSAAQVIDIDTLEQVAEYDHASAPHLFARHLAYLGRLYHLALLVPEVQGSGGGGGRELVVYLRDTYHYRNIHTWQHPDRINRGSPVLYGWETNARTRPRMIARVREHVLEQSAVVHSRKLANQLENFGENDVGKIEALTGHDDLLMAWGIALVSRHENFVAKRPPREMDDEALQQQMEEMGIAVISSPSQMTDWAKWHKDRLRGIAKRPRSVFVG